MSEALKSPPRQVMDPAERRILEADNNAFQIDTARRLADAEDSIRKLRDSIRSMTLREGLASYLKENVGTFTSMVMAVIITVAFAYSITVWAQRPPAPKDPEVISKLCSSEVLPRKSWPGSRRNLVITKVDGTTAVMPVDSCATIVETLIPAKIE